jgi:hypothetical protein
VIKKEEIAFQQQVVHLQSGAQRKKKNKTNVIQQRIETLAARFENIEIDLKEYLLGLSLLMVKDIKVKK